MCIQAANNDIHVCHTFFIGLLCKDAQVEISNKVKDLLQMYHSSSWHCEPYCQDQNAAEGSYRITKNWTNTIMNRKVPS